MMASFQAGLIIIKFGSIKLSSPNANPENIDRIRIYRRWQSGLSLKDIELVD
jgi:hypothetical protein